MPAPDSRRAEAEPRLAQKPHIDGAHQQPQVSAQFTRVLDKAFDEAKRLDDEYVSPRHCVLIEHLPGEWAAECWGTDGLGVILREDAAYDISHHFTVGSVVVLRPGDVLVIGRTRMPPFTPERVAA